MNASRNALILALAFLGAGTASAQADSFPSRPITIVVPYPAGGTSDAQVRLIQEKLREALGQPVIVENKAGASGSIGTQQVARSKADGYTLLHHNTGMLIAPMLNDKAGYDPLKDFKPVGIVSTVPLVLVSSKAVPGSSASDLFQYARSRPNGVLYGSAGPGSFGHISSVRLAQLAGIKVDHVPYKGEANTTQAVRAGDVEMLLTTPSPAMLGQVQQGNIKLLAVAAAKPTPLLPGVPVLSTTLPGFSAEIWFGFLAPAGTPDEVVARINAALKTVMADESIRTKLQASGAMPQASTPAEFAKVLRDESVQLREVVTKYGIKAE